MTTTRPLPTEKPAQPPCRVAVMGAGAVGCYYGGMLARAGHGVTLIGRPSHVNVIQRVGLQLETQVFHDQLPVLASTEARAVAGAMLVLLCVKSSDTEEAALQMREHLAPEALVLSLQNGVDNAARAQALLSQQVWPAVVYVAAEMAGPGHVKHHGRGDLVLGPTPRPAEATGGLTLDNVLALFDAAGVPVQTSDDVDGALWAKLILNCAYNALSAITGLPYGRLLHAEGMRRVMHDAVHECLAVARAVGVTVPGDMFNVVDRLAASMPDQRSSTAQDLARGKHSEIDHLNGYIVRRGTALGVSTPVNAMLHSLVKAIEGRPSTG